MSAHCCINCWKCGIGCPICGNCGCSSYSQNQQIYSYTIQKCELFNGIYFTDLQNMELFYFQKHEHSIYVKTGEYSFRRFKNNKLGEEQCISALIMPNCIKLNKKLVIIPS